MEKTILFPFDINDDNRNTYAKAIELAKDKKAKLVLLTALSNNEYEQKIDHVYFHLLELNGHYQTQNNNWVDQPNISIERKIKNGNLIDHLKNVLIEKAPNWIIKSHLSSSINLKSIEKLLGIQKIVVIDF